MTGEQLHPDKLPVSLALVERCVKQFASQEDDVVGFALALMLASFIARHRARNPDDQDDYQRETLEHHIQTVLRLLPGMNQAFERKGPMQ